MRFVTYLEPADDRPDRDIAWLPERHRAGVLAGDEIHPLKPGVSLLGLLREGTPALHAAGERALGEDGGVRPAAAVRLLAPLPTPPTIRDFMTFEQHIAPGYAARGAAVPPLWYAQPVFYFSNPYATTGPYDDVPVPPGSVRFDFEAEVAAVVGRPGSDLTPDQAAGHIAGYLVVNDWSARDLQVAERTVGLGPVKAKDTATTLGPALVTADELAPYRSGTAFDLGISVSVNGALFGRDRLDNMAWSFPEMVAFASRGSMVGPGDVLGSGTCANGCLFEYWARHGPDSRPPLREGDVVEITVDVLGTIRNRVVAGPQPVPLR
ncbi:MAG TPA: fumarylacetoacetate hydrolase family protein [Micromonosporaceae bacterium]|nr:fumarylacetoacetate hydrolase family protein [Micromonosporaceae bacterium]